MATLTEDGVYRHLTGAKLQALRNGHKGQKTFHYFHIVTRLINYDDVKQLLETEFIQFVITDKHNAHFG